MTVSRFRKRVNLTFPTKEYKLQERLYFVIKAVLFKKNCAKVYCPFSIHNILPRMVQMA